MNDERIDHLVTRAQGGDSDAFGALYEHYAERVYRYLLARVREPADAEDLLHRVFIKMIDALPRYEQRGLPFAAWLLRIAHNAVIDFGRRDLRQTPIAALDLTADTVESPAALFEAAEERAAILTAFEVLTPDQRDVLLFRFFADLSPAEIGTLMGKREGSVRALQFRALGRLRQHDGLLALHLDRVGLGAA